MKTTRIFFYAATAALLAGPAFGGIIVQDLWSTGSTGSTTGWRAVSWTQTATYSSVSIGADVSSGDGHDIATGTAYLMTQLGPSPLTTAANEVTAPFSISVSSNPPINTMTPLFSGLTLGPGTYFLLIDPNPITGVNALYWAETYPSLQSLGTGVTQGWDVVLSGSIAAFSPASSYVGYSPGPDHPSLIFSVNGTLVTGGGSTPEPSTIVMFLSGLAGIGIALRKRRIA
jgi:hypothetical protein